MASMPTPAAPGACFLSCSATPLPLQTWEPAPPADIEDRLRLLDGYYIPTRDPDSYPEGTPGEHFGKMQSEQALLHAGAVVEWVSAAAGQPLGVFGSYGRGTAAVGSDLDLLLILKTCDQPIWDRLRRWDSGALPQWNPRLAQVLQEETHWLTATPPPFNQPPAQTDGRSDP